MINRDKYLSKIHSALLSTPVVALIGARQVGKTTLARQIAEQYPSVVFFDLENPAHLSRLQEPMLALQDFNGLVVIDEIQHAPDIFKVLRVLADRPFHPCRFLVLGSASPSLLKQSSESLAGRIAYIEIEGFTLEEVGIKQINTLWLQGGFPRSFTANTPTISYHWREEFIRTFLEKDLPQLGIKIPAITMRRFWMMLAHYHGQIWNSSEFARSFGMSDKTIKHYLDILSSTFVVRQIAPWWENISKRQVKAPKVYISDSGILHTLLGLPEMEALESHPKVGASWEGFLLDNVLYQLNIKPHEAFYWRTHSGSELDLLIIKGNIRIGFEFKRTSAPTITKSLQDAYKDLRLTNGYVIHAGKESFPLTKNIYALSVYDLPGKLTISW